MKKIYYWELIQPFLNLNSIREVPKLNQRGSKLLGGGSNGNKITIKTFEESLQLKFKYKNDRNQN